jgi:hypothetical protein
VGFLLQALEDDRLQVEGEPCLESAWALGNPSQDPGEELGGAPNEWGPPGEHFVEGRAQRVDVASAVDQIGAPLGLLGAHVGGRTHDLTCLGHALLFGVPCQAEVRQHGLAARFHEHVGGLEVAVEDGVAVRVVEGVGEAACDLRCHLRREDSPLTNAVLERGPLDQVHGEELTLLDLPHLQDPHDVGVLEAGRRAGLDLEASPLVRAGARTRLEQLERHASLKAHVLGQIHDPHSASGQLLLDPVGAEHVPRGGGLPALGGAHRISTRALRVRHAGAEAVSITRRRRGRGRMAEGKRWDARIGRVLAVESEARDPWIVGVAVGRGVGWLVFRRRGFICPVGEGVAIAGQVAVGHVARRLEDRGV